MAMLANVHENRHAETIFAKILLFLPMLSSVFHAVIECT
jgi:hypothetical protein